MLDLGGGGHLTSLAVSVLALRGWAIPLRHPDFCIHTVTKRLQIRENTLSDKIVPCEPQPTSRTARRMVQIRAQSLPARAVAGASLMLALGRLPGCEVRQKEPVADRDAKKLRFKERCKQISPRLRKEPRMLPGARLRGPLPPQLLSPTCTLPKNRDGPRTEVPTQKLLPFGRPILTLELFRNARKFGILKKRVPRLDEVAQMTPGLALRDPGGGRGSNGNKGCATAPSTVGEK